MNGFETEQERSYRHDHIMMVRKLYEEKVRKLKATGMSNADIAKEVGLCEAIVRERLAIPLCYNLD
jgi:DNA-binding NarL/FixJ family response regulator